MKPMKYTLIFFLYALWIALGTSIFAESSEDELNSVKVIISGSKEAEGGPWGKEDDQKKSFKDVKIFDDINEEHAKNQMKQAAKQFNESFKIFSKAKEDKEKKEQEFSKRVYYFRKTEGNWREKEAKRKEKAILDSIIIKGRRQAITKLIKAMIAIDRIKNRNVISNNVYIDLKASVYREYIKHQFNLKNYNQSADILEKYIGLSETYEQEAQPHKMLAICYEYNQKYAAKYKENNIYQHYKNLKYEHLLRYTELMYGKDSSQYNRVLKKVTQN
ncbi:MAG: hypothetical protein AAF518_06645 [Spirochaetota bacterium]